MGSLAAPATCLIVDDSRVIRTLARKMLTGLGLSTSEAENGAVAYDMCIASRPDLVLLDWNMPVLDGLSFLKRIRAAKLDRQPKVLFCTTESEFSKIAEALAAGADEYIMKPFDEEILASKLHLVGVI
ncbi:MAG: response regulator [Rhodospirillaceae bacterium]